MGSKIDCWRTNKGLKQTTKEVSAMTGHWLKDHKRGVEITAFGIFMAGFVAVLAFSL